MDTTPRITADAARKTADEVLSMALKKQIDLCMNYVKDAAEEGKYSVTISKKIAKFNQSFFDAYEQNFLKFYFKDLGFVFTTFYSEFNLDVYVVIDWSKPITP